MCVCLFLLFHFTTPGPIQRTALKILFGYDHEEGVYVDLDEMSGLSWGRLLYTVDFAEISRCPGGFEAWLFKALYASKCLKIKS